MPGHSQLLPECGSTRSNRLWREHSAHAARVQAWRQRLSQPVVVEPAELLLAPVLGQVLLLLRWLLVLALAVCAAAWCVAPILILPSALALTAGLWLTVTGARLARRLRLPWSRALDLLRRCCTGDNFCQVVFMAGIALAAWSLGGFHLRGLWHW